MTVSPVATQMRLLVVDDEDLARQRLLSLLSRRADVDVIGECATGAEAVQSIRALKPDCVLLDVQMPELDGFDVISEIGPQNMPVFSDANLSPEDKRDIITALKYSENTPSPGGVQLGSLGPVAEGLFAWIFGLGAIVALTVWITARAN